MAHVKNYMDVLSAKFPTIQASISGDPSIYENIKVEPGSPPLPAKEILDSASLDIDRTEVWRLIQAERELRREGGVKVGDNWFHSDDPSRIQQIALVMLGTNMPSNIMWKTMQGTFVQMTPQLASAIFQSIIAQDNKIYTHAEHHRQSMIQAGDDPIHYNYKTDWPQTYAEWAAAQVPPAPPPSPNPEP